MTEELTFETLMGPSAEDLRPVDQGLHQYNVEHLGEDIIQDYHRLGVVARDGEDGIRGGVHGELAWEWLHIDTLWVDAAWRGQGIGSALLRSIENLAVERGARGAHLETTSFQAYEFYLRRGYEVFGELGDKPEGVTWYYMKKTLV
ncbi:MAG: GNAT family N-acetyltransferase [Anaerolineae bacterium]